MSPIMALLVTGSKPPNLLERFLYNTEERKEAQREIPLVAPLFVFDSLSQYYPSDNGGYWGKLSFFMGGIASRDTQLAKKAGSFTIYLQFDWKWAGPDLPELWQAYIAKYP